MSIDRRTLLAGALALPLAAQGGVQASAYRHGALKGFVLGGVERDPALLQAMAALGANFARVFLRWYWTGERYRPAREDVRRLRLLLELAHELGMRMSVAAWFEGAENADFWGDATRASAFVKAWGALARELGAPAALAGLDLLNEPVPPMPSGDARQAQALWRPLAVQAVAAIRAEGLLVPVLYEPAPGANVMGLEGLEPLDDPQVVYSIHFYTPHDITHQGVAPTWTRRIPYPADAAWQLGAWDRELGVGVIDAARLQSELRKGIAFAKQHDAVLQVGEFSCVRWAPGDSAARWIADCLQIFDRQGWSWNYHEFRGWPGWDAEVADADPAATRRSADAPVMRLLRESMARRPRELT